MAFVQLTSHSSVVAAVLMRPNIATDVPFKIVLRRLLTWRSLQSRYVYYRMAQDDRYNYRTQSHWRPKFGRMSTAATTEEWLVSCTNAITLKRLYKVSCSL